MRRFIYFDTIRVTFSFQFLQSLPLWYSTWDEIWMIRSWEIDQESAIMETLINNHVKAYEKSATWSLSDRMIIGTRVFSKPDIWPHGNCLWKIYGKAGLRESGKEPPVSEAKCGDFDFHFIVQAFRKLSSQIPIRVRLLTPVILTSASGYVVDMSI